MANQTMTALEWIKDIQNSRTTDSKSKEWIQQLLDSSLDIENVYEVVLGEVMRTYTESKGTKTLQNVRNF